MSSIKINTRSLLFLKTVSVVSIIITPVIAEYYYGESTAAVNSEDFVFLGKIEEKIPDSDDSAGNRNLRASSYYISKKAITWKEASRACKSIYGFDADLLQIESEDELLNVNVFFDNTPDTGYRYWSGGRYNSSASQFIWSKGGEPIGSYVPWDSGEPRLDISDSQDGIRVVLCKSYEDVKIQTEDGSSYLRYICEVPPASK